MGLNEIETESWDIFVLGEQKNQFYFVEILINLLTQGTNQTNFRLNFTTV